MKKRTRSGTVTWRTSSITSLGDYFSTLKSTLLTNKGSILPNDCRASIKYIYIMIMLSFSSFMNKITTFAKKITLPGALTILASVFWSGNAMEKHYAVFVEKTPYELCLKGLQSHAENLNNKDDYFLKDGSYYPKGMFRLGGRRCQVRQWFEKIGISVPISGVLMIFTLTVGAALETLLAGIFLFILYYTFREGFPSEWFQAGCLLSILFFTALTVVDIFLAGDRLELFEHVSYILAFAVFAVLARLCK